MGVPWAGRFREAVAQGGRSEARVQIWGVRLDWLEQGVLVAGEGLVEQALAGLAAWGLEVPVWRAAVAGRV